MAEGIFQPGDFEESKKEKGAFVNKEALKEIAKNWDTYSENEKRKLMKMLPDIASIVLKYKENPWT